MQKNNNNDLILVDEKFVREFNYFKSEDGIRILTEEDLAQVTAGMQTATGAASDLICPTCSISLFYVTKLETPSGPQSLYRCFGCGLMYVSKK